MQDIVDQLSNVSVDVAVIPSEAIQLAPDYRVHLLGQLPVLTLWQRPFRDINGLVKRGEDLLIAGAATVVLSPIMLITGLLVKFSSPGPIFFVQPRIGFNNEISRCSSSARCTPTDPTIRPSRRRRPTTPGDAGRPLAAQAQSRRAAAAVSMSSRATCRWSARGRTRRT